MNVLVFCSEGNKWTVQKQLLFFLLCLLKTFFSKTPTLRIEKDKLYYAAQPIAYFYAVLPVDQNLNWFHVIEVILDHCNVFNNDYHHDSRVLYAFGPNK